MYLLITLGHNSSAIGIKNNKEIIAGYEEERFTRKKSENQFPINSINKIFEYYPPRKDEKNTIFVSHWYDNFEFWKNKTEEIKRWDYDLIDNLVSEFNFEIVGLTENFTHHDAHAYASLAFLNSYRKNLEDVAFIVADGFGNNQEVISIYEKDGKYLKKIQQISGYYNSLGLFYQYATSFCGMKENQDEYKFLGYEIYIDEVLNDKELETINRKIASLTENFLYEYPFVTSKTYIDVSQLNNLKDIWHKIFNSIVGENRSEHQERIIIGYFVQSVIEEVMIKFIKPHKNVVLSGGLFYNVKLNNRIMKHVDNICIMPVCGDQGAAIGLFEYDVGGFKFDNLLWGKREIVSSFNKEEDLINEIASKLRENKIVNIVSGNMEFGPRALCNTTTLALPLQKNVERINSLNNRSTIMPMAPVMLEENLDYFFNKEDYEKVIGSLEYMIITLDYKDPEEIDEYYDGIMHKYPLEERYSGRPQVVKDKNSIIYKVLHKMEPYWKALINTSFNVHGRPIVNTMKDAIDDYEYQINGKPSDTNILLFNEK